MALFNVRGIVYRRVLSDNGFAYKSHGWRNAAQALAVKVKKTRPYIPRTNGKAERFMKSLLAEWAYVCPLVPQRHEMSCCRFSCGFCCVRRCYMDLGGLTPPAAARSAVGTSNSLQTTARQLDCLSASPLPLQGHLRSPQLPWGQ